MRGRLQQLIAERLYVLATERLEVRRAEITNVVRGLRIDDRELNVRCAMRLPSVFGIELLFMESAC